MFTYRKLIYFSILIIISLAFFLGAFILESLGIQYVSKGGSSILKIHASSYVVLIIFAITALRFGPKNMANRLGAIRGYWWLSITFISIIILYGLLRFGPSGLASIVDTILVSLLIMPLIMFLTPAQKSKVISFFAWLILFNSIIAIIESGLKKHIFVAYLPDVYQMYFRSFAFMAHPLNNAMITAALAPLLMSKTRVPPPIYFSIVLLALFAFGARAATVFFVLASFALTFGKIKRFLTTGIPVNKKKLAFLYVIFLMALTVGFIVLLYSSIGDRILNKLHFDGSAQARFDVFNLLEQLTYNEWLFGASLSLLENIEDYIGIMVIENYVIGWILYFGAIVTCLFLVSIFSTPFKIAMLGGVEIKVSIITFTLISITNNSLSTKTPALLFLLIIMLCKLGLEEANEYKDDSKIV